MHIADYALIRALLDSVPPDTMSTLEQASAHLGIDLAERGAERTVIVIGSGQHLPKTLLVGIPRGPERPDLQFVRITDELFEQLSDPVSALPDVATLRAFDCLPLRVKEPALQPPIWSPDFRNKHAKRGRHRTR
ncbi:hypothetical protein [Pseudomonas sp. PS01301]|uniref:hypothetical protein n=1 Tax=Pseudomonas sp. PS01301 TaxID=2991437 RepID=UPI00249C6F26|nr:hypothetical protein [Pseudomonas sp. PS01301]